MRLLLVLAALLAGCAGPPPPPGDAIAQAREAAQQGNASAAIRALKAASAEGDLTASTALADAYARGYLAVTPPHVRVTTHLPIRTWPWEASRWRRARDAAVARGVAAGDPVALYLRADALDRKTFEDGRWAEPTEDARAESAGLLLRLAHEGHTPAMLRLGLAALPADREEAGRWLRRAEAAGDPQACWLLFLLVDQVPADPSPEALPRQIDHAEACHALGSVPPGYDHSARVVGDLRAAAATGDPEAHALLTALAADGVFERHPRL